MPRRVLLILAAFCILARVSVEGRADCSTPDPLGPPCFEYWRTDAVFIGLVTKVERTPSESVADVRTTAYLNVEEAFRGVGRSAIVLELDQCSYEFRQGERYLVYAVRNVDTHKLEVRAGNSRTRPVSEASEDLQYIRGLTTAEPGTRLFGKANVYNLNIKDDTYTGEALPNVKITLAGIDQRWEVITDAEGKYEFRNLPLGRYWLRAEFPSYLGGSLSQTIRVTHPGCILNVIPTYHTGSIEGSILDAGGNPLASVPVSIVRADASAEQILEEGKDKSAWSFALTNDKGDYSFWPISPGRYLIVINRAEYERSRGTKVSQALPRLFYPGVIDLASATVVVVADKQPERQQFVFRLPVPE